MSGWPEKPNLLVSYAYVKDWGKDMEMYRDTNLIVDSGAFTAATTGGSINISEYANWLEANTQYVKHAAVLDVIGDYRATATNLEWMENRLGGKGISILPAWHIGSPVSELDRLTKQYDYIAIGGAVPYARNPKVLMRQLVMVHRIARDNECRLHGLGITGGQSLYRLPWHSVDSSSWASGFRYGRITLYDERAVKHNVRIGKPIPIVDRRVVRAYGGDPNEVEDKAFCYRKYQSKIKYDEQRQWVGESMARAQWVVQKVLHQRYGSPVNIYLADPALDNHRKAIAGFHSGDPYAHLERTTP